MEEEVFELVFEGPVDSSPETLRKLKSTLITDLSLTIEQARDLFAGPKSTILKTTDKNLIDSYFNAIKNAGGKVLIVQPNAEEKVSADPIHRDDELWNEELGNGDNLVPHESEEEVNILDLDLTASKPPTPAPQTPTKAADVTPQAEEMDIASLLEAVEEEDSPPPPPTSKAAPDPVPAAASAPSASPSPTKSEPQAFSFSFAEEGQEESPVKIAPEPPAPKKEVSAPKTENFDFAFSEADESKTEAKPTEAKSTEPKPAMKVDSSSPSQPESPAKSSAPEFETNSAPKEEAKPKAEVVTPPPPKIEAKEATTTQAPSLDQTQDEDYLAERARLKRKKKLAKIKGYLEIGVPVVLGAVILFVGNWYYFSRQAAPPLPMVDKSAAALKNEKDLKNEQAPDPNAGIIELEGSATDGEVTLIGNFILDKELFKQFSLVLTTPEPPSLTNEEIVNNQTRRPWLEKITIEDPDLTYEGGGRFRASTPAKVIIEEGGERSRNITTAELRGMLNANLKQVIVEVTVKSQIDKTDFPNPYLEKIPDGGYRYFIRGRLDLKK